MRNLAILFLGQFLLPLVELFVNVMVYDSSLCNIYYLPALRQSILKIIKKNNNNNCK